MLVSAVSLAVLQPVSGAESGTLTVVALTGDPVPDGNGKFFDFSDVLINDAGQVAFYADLFGTQGGGRDNAGVFRKDGNTFIQLARAGQNLPSGEGVLAGRHDFAIFSTRINQSGQVAFQSVIYRNQTRRGDRTGLFVGDGNPWVQWIGAGQSLSGNLGELEPVPPYTSFAFNDAGQILFVGTFKNQDGPGKNGIFLTQGTNVTLVATTGESAEDYYVLGSSVGLNHVGQVAYVASVGSWGNDAVFRRSGASAPVRIAQPEQAVPGGTLQMEGYGYLSINDAGQVAFSGQITTESFETASALLLGDGTTVTVLVRDGDAVPGGQGRIDAVNTLSASSLNAAGQIAFWASLNGAGGEAGRNLALFRAGGQGLIEIVRAGETAPEGNGTFDFDAESWIESVSLNPAGQVAFGATLAGTSGGYADNSGIYFHDDALGLLKVARKGDPFLGSTFVGLEFWSATGVFSGLLNNRRQVAFEFDLNDGRSGIAVWTAPAGGSSQPLRSRITYDPAQKAVVTSWPAEATGVTLESSTNLANPAGWTRVDGAPVPSGSEWHMTQPIDTSERFFRLKKNAP